MQHVKLGDRDPAKFRDESGNRTIKIGAEGTIYRGFLIVPKKDFGKGGYLVSGHFVTEGYIVGDGPLSNVMAGATWFQTVQSAMRAIDDWITAESLERTTGEHPFWALTRFRHQCEERAPELALLLQAVMDNPEVRMNGTLFSQITRLLDEIDRNCDRRDTVVTVGGGSHKRGIRATGRFGLGVA